MSADSRDELIRRGTIALAADVGAIADLCADGAISREMAAWALRSCTARFDARSLGALGAHRDLEGQRTAIVLAHSVATGPLRAIAMPLLRGASHVLVRPARGQTRFAQRVAAHMAPMPVECSAP